MMTWPGGDCSPSRKLLLAAQGTYPWRRHSGSSMPATRLAAFATSSLAHCRPAAADAELCRLTVGDYQRGRIVVRQSKSGRPRDVRLTREGRTFFAALTSGRPANEFMFRRGDAGGWGPSHQARRMVEACKIAKIVPGISFHALRHSYASLAIMNGTPLLVVAENLGHADMRMVERHYGHLTEF